MKEILVVDLRAVMDRSPAGLAGARLLEAEWQMAQAAYAELAEHSPEEAQRYEAEAVRRLTGERKRLAARLLETVRRVLQELAGERQAKLVLDSSAVAYAASGHDVTNEVLARLEAAERRSRAIRP